MKDFVEAIYTKFNAGGTFKTLIAGRLEYGRAQAGTGDHAVYYCSTDADDLFRQSLDNVNVQFNCFSTVRDTCFDLLAACKTMFDNVQLTVTNHYPATLHREMEAGPIWDEQALVWQASIEFRAKLQHT